MYWSSNIKEKNKSPQKQNRSIYEESSSYGSLPNYDALENENDATIVRVRYEDEEEAKTEEEPCGGKLCQCFELCCVPYLKFRDIGRLSVLPLLVLVWLLTSSTTNESWSMSPGESRQIPISSSTAVRSISLTATNDNDTNNTSSNISQCPVSIYRIPKVCPPLSEEAPRITTNETVPILLSPKGYLHQSYFLNPSSTLSVTLTLNSNSASTANVYLFDSESAFQLWLRDGLDGQYLDNYLLKRQASSALGPLTFTFSASPQSHEKNFGRTYHLVVANDRQDIQECVGQLNTMVQMTYFVLTNLKPWDVTSNSCAHRPSDGVTSSFSTWDCRLDWSLGEEIGCVILLRPTHDDFGATVSPNENESATNTLTTVNIHSLQRWYWVAVVMFGTFLSSLLICERKQTTDDALSVTNPLDVSVRLEEEEPIFATAVPVAYKVTVDHS